MVVIVVVLGGSRINSVPAHQIWGRGGELYNLRELEEGGFLTEFRRPGGGALVDFPISILMLKKSEVPSKRIRRGEGRKSYRREGYCQ